MWLGARTSTRCAPLPPQPALSASRHSLHMNLSGNIPYHTLPCNDQCDNILFAGTINLSPAGAVGESFATTRYSLFTFTLAGTLLILVFILTIVLINTSFILTCPLHHNDPSRHVKHFQTTRRPTEPPPPPPPPPLPPPAPPPTSSPSEQVAATTSPLMPSPTLALNPASELITPTETTSLDLLQEPERKSSPSKTAAASGGGTKPAKPQNHACQECGKNFLTAFQLNKHRLGHSHNNCDKCDAKFAKKRLLVHHLKTVHYIATAEKYYSCNFCSRKFVKKPSLWGHLAEHTSGEQVIITSNTMN